MSAARPHGVRHQQLTTYALPHCYPSDVTQRHHATAHRAYEEVDFITFDTSDVGTAETLKQTNSETDVSVQ
ncbi:unnamed protein product [Heligmosomoides polygyrus]|uniref:Unspecified product n=1 Tax=Heligmosomoides polygyrus TaxID=6339 RepID=A0A183GGG5_HELPZ|nr:unnamed protein product [Heligmosomoides polygyrus]